MAESTVQSIEISAPAELLFEVAADVERYPSGPRVCDGSRSWNAPPDGMAHRAHFVVEGMVKEIEYNLVYDYDPPRRMSWVAEPGEDITLMEGSYDFKPLEDGATEVVYGLAPRSPSRSLGSSAAR